MSDYLARQLPNCTTVATAFFISFLIHHPEVALASPSDRACITIKDDRKGGLQDTDLGVVSDYGRFSHLGQQYRVHAFSLWGRSTSNSEKICLRYEIQNLEQSRVEAVNWKDAGIYFVDLQQERRIDWVRESTPPYPALVASSEIKAFQNSSASVRAYLPSGPKYSSVIPVPQGSPQKANLTFSAFDATKIAPDAEAMLTRAGLSTMQVAAVNASTELTSELR